MSSLWGGGGTDGHEDILLRHLYEDIENTASINICVADVILYSSYDPPDLFYDESVGIGVENPIINKCKSFYLLKAGNEYCANGVCE